MKILMLTPYLPYPLLSGGQIRSYNLLKKLSHQHEITLIALIKNEDEKQHISNIEKFCHEVIVCKRPEKPWTFRNILQTGFGKYPFLVIRNFSKDARSAVIEKLHTQTFDLIHAETFYVMPHIPHTPIPILLVEQTVEYLVYQHFVDTMRFFPLRSLFTLDVKKIKYWEEYYWRKATKVVAMSQADKIVMQSTLPKLNVEIVPNGVDVKFFLFQKKKLKKNPQILFVGNFKWLQNREAVTELVQNIWPQISREIPQAKLAIVGRFPTEYIRKLQDERISVSDNMDDIRVAYKDSDVLLAPIYGPGGTRYKILEAMASGIPVITTPNGIEGLGVKDGQEALIRRSSHELAQATCTLLQNKNMYEQLALNANKMVRKKYNWESIAGSLHNLYEEVAHEKNK